MTKVFIVTSGSYSDYHIVGAFSSDENAQKFSEHLNSKDEDYSEKSGVEEYDLDPGIDELNAGMRFFIVRMNLVNGDVDEVKEWSIDRALGERNFVLKAGMTYQHLDYPLFNTFVWADDSLGAIKVAGERRIAWKLEHPDA